MVRITLSELLLKRLVVGCCALAFVVAPAVAQDEPAKDAPAEKSDAEEELFAVPEGTADELFAFMTIGKPAVVDTSLRSSARPSASNFSRDSWPDARVSKYACLLLRTEGKRRGCNGLPSIKIAFSILTNQW